MLQYLTLIIIQNIAALVANYSKMIKFNICKFLLLLFAVFFSYLQIYRQFGTNQNSFCYIIVRGVFNK